MGDYTSFQLTVYACPPEAVGDVIGLINEYGLGEEWGGSPFPANGPTTLSLGMQYNDSEARCGITDEIGPALEALDVTFECWEDPKYEWLGAYHAHVPGVGTLTGDCDANGTIVVSSEKLIQLVNEATDLDTLKATVNRQLGSAVKEALEPLRSQFWEPTEANPNVVTGKFVVLKPLPEYYPTDEAPDEPITPEQVAPWAGNKVYVDLGDSVIDGGEITGELVAVFSDHIVVRAGGFEHHVAYTKISHIADEGALEDADA
jgi:hypothetical protein